MTTAIQTGILPDFDTPLAPRLTPSDFRRLVLIHWEWPDKVTAEHAGRDPHRVYEVRKKLGLMKYGTDHRPRKSPCKSPRKLVTTVGERFDLSGHVRDVLRFEH